MYKILLAASALLLLSGCNLGPEYRGPPASSAMAHVQPAQGFLGAQAGSQDEPPPEWWKLFRSEELNALERLGREANPEVRVALANLDRSRGALHEVLASGEPSAALNFAPGFQQLSAESYLYPGTLAPLGLYDLGLTVSYELDLFGRIRRAVEAARADDRALAAALALARVTVAAHIARAYLGACGSREQLDTARRSVDLQQRSASTTRALVSAGRSAQIDQARALGQLSQVRADLPRLEGEHAAALLGLAALLGRMPGELPKEVEACSTVPTLAEPLPLGDASALLRRRPDVRAADSTLAAATARIGASMAELYPRVSLGATVGSTGAIEDFFSRPTNRWGLGLIVQWEANRGRARARIEQAGAAQRAALAHFDDVVLSALRDVEIALQRYLRILEAQQDLNSAEARAREAELQAERLYQGGKVGFLEWLDAQRTLTVASYQVTRSHTDVALLQVSIFEALGDGWQSPP